MLNILKTHCDLNNGKYSNFKEALKIYKNVIMRFDNRSALFMLYIVFIICTIQRQGVVSIPKNKPTTVLLDATNTL